MLTKNYVLREVQDTDISNIHKGLSDPDITKYYDVHFPTLEATQEQMDWYHDLKKNGTGIWFCILDKQSDQFYGAAGFNDLSTTNKKAEIGMWLLKESWGKGIMTEVLPALFKYAFSDLGLNRIEGYVVSDNLKCKRGLEKINFTYEGTMREAEVKNGETISVDIYSILKSEWQSKQNE